jgi:hypothetical protein
VYYKVSDSEKNYSIRKPWGERAAITVAATHGPGADQPYFYRANQPEGREIKGVTGGREWEG